MCHMIPLGVDLEFLIPGSSPGMGLFFASSFFDDAISSAKQKKYFAGCGPWNKFLLVT